MLTETALTKDESKIKNLGPYACILRALLYANKNVSSQVAYRGILLSKNQYEFLKMKQQKNEKIRLQGFTSASTDKKFAEKELIRKRAETSDKIPALIQISLSHNHDVYELNSLELSTHYSTENEVVLQDGMALRFATEMRKQ